MPTLPSLHLRRGAQIDLSSVHGLFGRGGVRGAAGASTMATSGGGGGGGGGGVRGGTQGSTRRAAPLDHRKAFAAEELASADARGGLSYARFANARTCRMSSRCSSARCAASARGLPTVGSWHAGTNHEQRVHSLPVKFD